MKAITRVTLWGVIAATLFGMSGCIVDDRGHDHPVEHRDDDHRCDGPGHDHDDCHHWR